VRFLVALIAGVALSSGPAPAAAADRPNIVVFLSDVMGWGQLGFQGGKKASTPNIDRLAREGVSLTQFYVHSVCTPTRSALLTGRYPVRTGTEERVHGNDTAGMLTDERTLADALKQAGYATAIFGKWHLGEWHKRHLPMQRGFEHQYGFYGAVTHPFTRTRNGVYDWHRNEQPAHEPGGYTTFLIADEFQRVLDRRDAGKPFFYYVPFNAVHGPHDAPPEYIQKHEGDRQLAMLECMDVGVGRMLDALREKGVLDETLVIFFNDNGGPRRVMNAPFKGTKGTGYEGGVRVPCVMRWPGKISPGTTVDRMIHVTDLYPTLIKLAGGSLDQPLPPDGTDVWPTITEGKPSPRREVVYNVPGEFGREMGDPAIRVGDFKLVGEELYDIPNDPHEKTDVAARHPDVVKQLKARLAEVASQRRPPEQHERIPGARPLVKGERENGQPHPDWLKEVVKQAAEEPGGETPRRRRNRANRPSEPE
jgi:arylsulfatase A-like enzyme